MEHPSGCVGSSNARHDPDHPDHLDHLDHGGARSAPRLFDVPRVAAFAVFAVFAVFVVMAAGCNDAQKTTSVDITGRWQSEIDESVMSIEESGLFAMDIPGERLAIIGTVAVNGTQVSFRNRPETKLCVDDDGVYEVQIVDDRMTAHVVRDTCPSRVLHMSRPWRRLSAERSPSSSDR